MGLHCLHHQPWHLPGNQNPGSVGSGQPAPGTLPAGVVEGLHGPGKGSVELGHFIRGIGTTTRIPLLPVRGRVPGTTRVHE
jgi:hypothetical protein